MSGVPSRRYSAAWTEVTFDDLDMTACGALKFRPVSHAFAPKSEQTVHGVSVAASELRNLNPRYIWRDMPRELTEISIR